MRRPTTLSCYNCSTIVVRVLYLTRDFSRADSGTSLACRTIGPYATLSWETDPAPTWPTGLEKSVRFGSLELDASIATSHAPAGPGPSEAEAIAAGRPGDADQLEPIPGGPGDPGPDPDLADRRRGALPGRGASESGILEFQRIALERLAPPVRGLDDSFAPKTVSGRFLAMFLLVTGVGLAGLFTASVASLLVERYLRRRDVSHFEMDDHLVLCNWAPRGLEWIREVHSKIITEPRPIVIIHDNPDEIDLPDKQDEPAFNDVYIVKGDPTNEVILHRATVAKAYSVIVLSDAREGKHADGKSILICIAIRHICQGRAWPEYRRRVPQPRQPPPPAQGGRQRGRLVGFAGAAAAGSVGPVPRDVRVLPGAAHRPPRRQRGLPGAGPRGAGRPRLHRAQRAVPPLPQRPPLLPAHRHPARRRDDAQPHQRRGRPAASPTTS